MVVVCKTMRAVSITPFQTLSRGWMTFTVLTLISIGTIAQVCWTTKAWQVSNGYPFISSVQFRNPFPTLATSCACFCAFNGYDNFSTFTHRSLQDTHVWNVVRDCDLCFCHFLSVFSRSKLHFCHDFIAFPTPTSGGSHGNSQ